MQDADIDYDEPAMDMPPPSNKLPPFSKTFFVKIALTIIIGLILLIGTLILVRKLFSGALSKATDVSIWVDKYPEFNYQMPCINHSPGFSVLGSSPANFADLHKYVELSVPNDETYRIFIGNEEKKADIKETGNMAVFAQAQSVVGSLNGNGLLSANRIYGQINWDMMPSFQVEYQYQFTESLYSEGVVEFNTKSCSQVSCTSKTATGGQCTATCNYAPEGEAGTLRLTYSAKAKGDVSDTEISLTYTLTARMPEVTIFEDKNHKQCTFNRDDGANKVYRCPTEPGNTIRIFTPCSGAHDGLPEPGSTVPVPIQVASVDKSGSSRIRRRVALPYNAFGLFVALIDFSICGAIIYFVYKGEMKSRSRRQYETLVVE